MIPNYIIKSVCKKNQYILIFFTAFLRLIFFTDFEKNKKKSDFCWIMSALNFWMFPYILFLQIMLFETGQNSWIRDRKKRRRDWFLTVFRFLTIHRSINNGFRGFQGCWFQIRRKKLFFIIENSVKTVKTGRKSGILTVLDRFFDF